MGRLLGTDLGGLELGDAWIWLDLAERSGLAAVEVRFGLRIVLGHALSVFLAVLVLAFVLLGSVPLSIPPNAQELCIAPEQYSLKALTTYTLIY